MAQLNLNAQTTLKLTVKEASIFCQRMMPGTCLLVQKEGSTSWENFYDQIKGFAYQQGFRYEIEVIQTERKKPVPQDLSAYTYELKRILSKKIVLTESTRFFWKIVELNGKDVTAYPFTLQFMDSLKRITGKSGCNTYSAEVKLNEQQTKMQTQMGLSTRMACEGDVMELEQAFLAQISNTSLKLKQKGNQWIWKKGCKTVLKAEIVEVENQIKETNPAWAYFEGKRLNLIQLNGKSYQAKDVHMEFDVTNQRISGFTPCNSFSGNFEVNGEQLRFKNVTQTEKACLDTEKNKIEKDFLDILSRGNLRYDFADQVLNVYDLNDDLVAMFGIGK